MKIEEKKYSILIPQQLREKAEAKVTTWSGDEFGLLAADSKLEGKSSTRPNGPSKHLVKEIITLPGPNISFKGTPL